MVDPQLCSLGANLYADHTFFDAQQLHRGAIAPQLWNEPLHRLVDAVFEAVGMQPIEHQQAAHDGIVSQLFDERHTRVAGFSHNLQRAFETRAVKLHNQLHELGGGSPHRRVCDGLDFLHQGTDSLNPLLKFLFVRH